MALGSLVADDGLVILPQRAAVIPGRQRYHSSLIHDTTLVLIVALFYLLDNARAFRLTRPGRRR